MDLEQVKKIYFIGMGGIGMSAAAGLAKEQDFEVMGSDATTVYPPAQEVLAEHGIDIGVGYNRDRIAHSGADLFVVSSGEDEHNPEVAWLIETDTPYISFCELLYHLSLDKLRVVVSGTHGKSTTAGLLGHLLRSIDDSSFMVGAVLKNYNANFYSGQGNYIVFEGDEYKSTFDDPTPKMHYYKADVLVLTNLEFDHPDMFKDLEEIKGEFKQLVASLPDDGIVLYNADNQNLADVVYGAGRRSFTFGIDYAANIQAVDITHSEEGARFTVVNRLDPANTRREHYETTLTGEINVYNALAAIATLRALGFQPELIQQYLHDYSGVKRRFDILSEAPVVVIDDYAHHPTAVRETLEAARQRFFNTNDRNEDNSTSPSLSYFRRGINADNGSDIAEVSSGSSPKVGEVRRGMSHGRLWAVFQPHTYSRTQATLSALAESFGSADQVLLAPVYGAREHATKTTITDQEVLAAIQLHQPNTRLLTDKAEALAILTAEAKSGDVVVVMAVGSFNRLAYEVVGA